MKVNKRIGKLKQWTGEKLGGQQKTELSEDFQSLEQDVELRKAGVEKMYSVSKEYSKHLTRKLEAEGTETGKVLPIDGLGLVLANHGDEFGSDSSFGEALVSFGKAQQQMATATANFADHMNSGWLTSLEKSLAQMSEYTNQRKKLDSRRLTYDAMLAKVQKSKKEKRDLEDDLRVAKNRYEETSEEVQERAVAIQDSEADQMIALTRLLEIESNWVDEQKRILDDLKRSWVDPSAFKVGSGERKKTAHSFGAEPPPPSRSLIKGKTAPHRRSARRQPRPAVTAPPKPRQPPSRRGSLLKEKPAPASAPNGSRYGGVRIPGMPPATASIQSDDSLSPTLDSSSRRRSNGTLRNQNSSSNLRRSVVGGGGATNGKGSTGGGGGKMMRAKWAYNATESDELELEVGDRVRVTNEINAQWFVGRSEASGRTGMFPAAYCVSEQEPEPGRYLTPERQQDTTVHPHIHRPPSSTIGAPVRTGSYPGKPAPSSSIGKRAPPPPPSRRATTSSSAKPPTPALPPPSHDHDAGQPEAFGSVSELKKRLGMFK
ncbi:hypothetical protein PtA15_11A236 [Puccinia triticina]|uniref:SH3 domain-containing protein n=1 Tax=Puccinia triticina TaxID=208348 RepID=A0ABY7CZK6_9BASI|nr:uncharacterized protein PtA15_11A236 [Puccinia triticina]WAQ89546.1 hypothetical protein PtA15_11A236 [Puccinia triticina]WAR59586.1 hypothetical protein PtB15_11B226 [Puccinia triticina]